MLDPDKHREMQERKHAYAKAVDQRFVWRARRNRLLWLSVAVLIIALDQVSKWHVTQNVFFPRMFGQDGQGFVDWMVDAPGRLPYYFIPMTSYFNLVMAWNTGVSFSLFSGIGGYTYLVLIVIALAITALFLYWLWKAESHFHGLCYAVVIGGALGNVMDRARFGAVIDFLDFHLYGYHWPAFNVADMAVVGGIVVLIGGSLAFDIKKKRRYRKKMKQNRHMRIFLLIGLTLSVSACGSVRNTLGLEKDSPDEFAVLTRAPLEVPPHLVLPTPVPGKPRPQETAALDQAQQAVFGKDSTQENNTQTSSAEDQLLQKTGADKASPKIRAVVNNETRELAERNVPTAQRLINLGGKTESSATVVDAKAELERLRENKANGKDITHGETPFIEE